MKLSNTNLSIIIFLVLLVFLSGCISGIIPTPPKGVISGRVMMPADTSKLSKDINGWVPAVNTTVTICDAEGVTHTVTTDKGGYYGFENIAVNPYTVITANIFTTDYTITIKKTIPQAVAKNEDYDVGIMTPESTAFSLIIEQLLAECVDLGNIVAEEIKSMATFASLVNLVTNVLEDQGDVTEAADVTKAVDNIVQDILNPPTLSSPPPSTEASSISVKSVAITGDPIVGALLTATIEPMDASVKYQWKVSDTEDGTYEDIPNATSNIYTIAADDTGKYINVTVTGTGKYKGTKISEAIGPVISNYTVSFNVTESGNFSKETMSGKPIEGVSIQVYSDATRTTEIGKELSTDTNGKTEIIIADGVYWFTATLQEYEDYESDFVVTDSDVTVMIAMNAFYNVDFKVTDTSDNSDIYGAEISVYSDGNRTSQVGTTRITDLSGRATLDVKLKNGIYYYTVSLYGSYQTQENEFIVDGFNNTVEVLMVEELSFKLLYSYGTQHVTFVEGYSINDGSQSFGDDHMYLRAYDSNYWRSEKTYVTDEKVDLTDVNEVQITWENISGVNSVFVVTCLVFDSSDSGKEKNHASFSSRISRTSPFSLETTNFDVPASLNIDIISDYYIRVHAVSNSEGIESVIKIYEIKLIY